LADGEQTLSEADQSNADLDQTTAESDQTSSERDQYASDRDQHASDLDQAASDRAAARGLDSVNYSRTRRTRASTALQRDHSTQVRSDAGRVRDATADRRDHDADARDEASSARDALAGALDREIAELEKSATAGTNGIDVEILLRAAQERKQSAASRARAAKQRDRAARDRAMARDDRQQAAADRLAAAEELAAEGVDHLTETLRRRVGLAAIQREIDRTARTQEGLVVAFVDVDGLKDVNDSRGHAAGDDLLRDVARCIKTGLRPYDVVLRYGGDELVCSLAGDDLAGISDRFIEISARIGECQEGASITVGFAERRHEEPLDDLIVRADHAMLAARNSA
jgi:diguanylate cyclase (GGDEF)-like protein